MDNPNNGGAAFPSDRFGELGMTLRDWFAGQASDSDVKRWKDIYSHNGTPITEEEARYAFADAMLAERQKERA